jgi:hypothetical protein
LASLIAGTGGEMSILVRQIKPIMLVSGALTMTMIYAAIAPQAALLGMFGEALSGPLAEVVVRNWGALIAIGGAMLVWAASRPVQRPMVLIAVGASKLVFVGLVLGLGQQFLSHQVGLAIAMDAIWISLFAAYLLETRNAAAAPT